MIMKDILGKTIASVSVVYDGDYVQLTCDDGSRFLISNFLEDTSTIILSDVDSIIGGNVSYANRHVVKEDDLWVSTFSFITNKGILTVVFVSQARAVMVRN